MTQRVGLTFIALASVFASVVQAAAAGDLIAEADQREAARQAPGRNTPLAIGFSSVTGSVADRFGGMLPGVDVTLTSDADGAVRTTTTGSDSTFAFASLPRGSYWLQLSRPGFARVHLPVSVSDDEAVTQAVTLQVADVTESLRVTPRGGAAPRVNPAMRSFSGQPEPAPRGGVCGAGNTGCVTAPLKIVDVRPVYPVSASSVGVQGIVIAEATIDEQGSVSDLRVLKALDDQLDAAVIDAVRQWKFVPTLLNGAPTASQLQVTVEFVLDGN